MSKELYPGLFEALKPFEGMGVLILSLYSLPLESRRSPLSALREQFFARRDKLRSDLPPALFEIRSLRGLLDFLIEQARQAELVVDAYYERFGVRRGGR